MEAETDAGDAPTAEGSATAADGATANPPASYDNSEGSERSENEQNRGPR